jgi:putative ABC transport system permease protein
MAFVKLALNNLLRHRIRSLLTLAGIAASVAVLFSIISFNRGFEKGLAAEIHRTGIHFMVVPSGCPHEVASLVLHGAVIPKYLDASVMNTIQELPAVETASPILVTQAPNPQKNRVDIVYGMEMSHITSLKPQWKIEGRIPQKDDEVILGSEVAGHDKAQIGDALSYSSSGKTFTVSGILEKTGSQDDAFVYMPIKSVQEMTKRPSGATAIGVKISKPQMINKITDELAQKAPGIQIVTMSQVISSLASLASSAKVLSLSIAVIAVLISAVGVMLSIIGSNIIENFVRKFMPYVPSGKMIGFDPLLALICVIFSIFAGILAGLYPAWKASKINPIEAIKG